MVRRGEAIVEAAQARPQSRRGRGGDGPFANAGAKKMERNVKTLLETFNQVFICPSGLSCLARISRLTTTVPTANMLPTLVVIDIPEDDDRNEWRYALQQEDAAPTAPSVYGSHLLRQITADAKEKLVANMVVTVVAAARRRSLTPTGTPSTQATRITEPGEAPETPHEIPPDAALMELPQDQASNMKYVDLGAIDVLDNPIRRESLPSLAIHIYRVHKEFMQRGMHLWAPTQKHESPWPGVPTPEPFAYLREVMVSDLAGQICGTIVDHPVEPLVIRLSEERKQAVINAISVWDFSAHDLSDDELLYATVTMVKHALNVEGMEDMRLPPDALLKFVVASRNGYNTFVPYHNFRHVVDVLQAVFHLLVRIGSLPSFPEGEPMESESRSTMAKMLRPFEALTLLIAAIGHDIGHPGVNNMFLVTIKSPLARLYNDKSVLESYHSAVYCHMLKKLWPAVVENEEMKLLLTSCILSTDMGIHKEYMDKLETLKESVQNIGDKPVDEGDLKTYRHVACNLLIKCADISNVARPFHCASVWTASLTEEFARQAGMEDRIKIPSTLFAPPARDIISLGKNQTGFMSFYALPLFKGVAELMPTTSFCVAEIDLNHTKWTRKMDEERLRTLAELPRDREGSDDSVDNNNNPPAADSSAAGAARSTPSGGPSGGSGAASGGQSRGSATHHDLDSADAPPTLDRGQQRQSNSRPNSRPVTWDEASANSRPATSSSARRPPGMPESGQVVTHRRSETTDGSASVPESGGWEGSARTGDSGKSEEKAECMSTARTSVESAGMRGHGHGANGANGTNGTNGAKRKSLVGSVSTPDLRSDSKGRSDHRRKGEKGDGVFASMRELTRRPSLGKFKFWKKREAGGFGGKEVLVPPMPNVMGRRGREGNVSVG
ncbi:hypothetical protein V500_05058 [Pseudogymnoascus sp. VKM F-4518 (FW-2643)]|nr:hypothetical protein V500_05058 [Pseudogymnoascus sp. VKM F-4518 (FW-2643)]